MERLAVILVCLIVGALLYGRGNRLYHRLAQAETASRRELAASSGLNGLSAVFLFLGLIQLMSLQSPEFSWNRNETVGVIVVGVVVGGVVAAVTWAKTAALQKYGRKWLIPPEEAAPERPAEEDAGPASDD